MDQDDEAKKYWTKRKTRPQDASVTLAGPYKKPKNQNVG